jgi:hypothetical protein
MEIGQSEWYMTKTFRQTNYGMNDGQRIEKTLQHSEATHRHITEKLKALNGNALRQK